MKSPELIIVLAYIINRPSPIPLSCFLGDDEVAEIGSLIRGAFRPEDEKLEIIRLVEASALPVRRTLEKIGIPRATFYRWYDLYRADGPEALDDRPPKPDRVWNRIPDDVRERIIRLALDEPALSPRELAVRFTDAEGYFVSEASIGCSKPAI